MNKLKLIITTSLLFFVILVFSQEKKYKVSCLAFYNLENLFDTINQPNVIDEEFTPTGKNAWGTMKYTNKLKNMAYAISQIGGKLAPKGPSVLGVSEIENRGVLEDLVKEPTIKQNNYQIVHYNSPDRRGVDVALLYNPSDFKVITSKSYRLRMDNDTTFRTRDQLLVEGLLEGEIFYFIVNHWPSRSGGEAKSRPKRIAAAELTKHISDSILAINKKAKIVIMGDLNDDPVDISTSKILNAKRKTSEVPNGGLFNTMWPLYDEGIGSLAYNDKWNLFDQIIISKGLLGEKSEKYTFWKAEVQNKDFLIQQEGRYKGYPLRTHAGGAWLNGYSDHFPTCIYVIKEIK
jgi:hypothetical protein